MCTLCYECYYITSPGFVAGYWWFGCDQESRPLVKDNSKVNFYLNGELNEEYIYIDDTRANVVDGEHLLEMAEGKK